MGSVAISGQDTIKINDVSLTDLADGDVGQLTYPNDLVTVKTGKNGNSIYGFNETGRQCEMMLRLIRGSANDKFLNNILAQMSAAFPGFVLLTGELIKNIGDGQGNVAGDTYILSGGVISKGVEAGSNADGNTDQSVAIYHLKFSNAPRTIT